MKTFKTAFLHTLPIMFSYVFLGTAFGIMMHDAGYGAGWSAAASIFIYTGAFQMALAGFLKAGAAIPSILITAFALGSRHVFYGISFIEDFKRMGKRMLYMIFSLTDETYALYCAPAPVGEGVSLEDYRFASAILCQLYWVAGSVLGAVIGNVVPFDFTGIDFTMTALFVTVFIDQWRNTKDHRAALTGLGASVLCLLLFGKSNFILPALLIASVVLVAIARKEENGDVR
ncbi:MAG: AzlC family ABC transporter permease [Clostridia bacterium]|nr:AzlC family ABC transporter permease [Clostridia bacterium]